MKSIIEQFEALPYLVEKLQEVYLQTITNELSKKFEGGDVSVYSYSESCTITVPLKYNGITHGLVDWLLRVANDLIRMRVRCFTIGGFSSDEFHRAEDDFRHKLFPVLEKAIMEHYPNTDVAVEINRYPTITICRTDEHGARKYGIYTTR